MKILVTGITGFTGQRVKKILLESGVSFTCLVRNPSHEKALNQEGILTCLGDVRDVTQLSTLMRQFSGLIHIVSLGFGSGPGVVEAAVNAGITRAIFVSTTAVFTRLNAGTKQLRLQAEDAIKRSPLQWTILRPTMIYGDSDDRNIFRFLTTLNKYPIFFVPGPGSALQQPVHVLDLSRAIISAFMSPKTIGNEYNISGKEPLSFNDMIHQALEFLNVRRKIIHLPWKPIALGCRLIEKYQKKPFLKEEQILRLLEDKAFSHQDAHRDFSFTPRSFEEGLLAYRNYFTKR